MVHGLRAIALEVLNFMLVLENLLLFYIRKNCSRCLSVPSVNHVFKSSLQWGVKLLGINDVQIGVLLLA